MNDADLLTRATAALTTLQAAQTELLRARQRLVFQLGNPDPAAAPAERGDARRVQEAARVVVEASVDYAEASRALDRALGLGLLPKPPRGRAARARRAVKPAP